MLTLEVLQSLGTGDQQRVAAVGVFIFINALQNMEGNFWKTLEGK